MVLGIKTQFVEKILNGSKIHTIRVDKSKRWQKGKKITFAIGVTTKRYFQFKEGVCKSNQAVELRPDTREIYLGLNGKMILLEKKHNEMFAKNDGFDTEDDFWNCFKEPFFGTVIHWTDFLYS